MQQQLFIKMVLDAWNQYVRRTDELLQNIGEPDLLKEIAPGRNTGKYILGHLASVHDRMHRVLGVGNELHPELREPFEVQPDGEQTNTFDTGDLKRYWVEINSALTQHFSELTPDEWFDRHTVVSEEDFKREPHRNRLNVIINRTNHIAWHYGQLLLLNKKG